MPPQPMTRSVGSIHDGHTLGTRKNIAQSSAKPASAARYFAVADSPPKMPGRMWWSTMAKANSRSARSVFWISKSRTVAPWVSRFSIANGRAAPKAKRKNGKTRSTHVRPGSSGLCACSGGGN